MQHLLPFYLFFCALSGLLAIFALLWAIRASGNKQLIWLLLFFIGMGTNVVANLVNSYLSINIDTRYSQLIYTIQQISLPISLLQFVAVPMFLHRFLQLSWKRLGDILILSLGILDLLICLSPWHSAYSTISHSLSLGPLYNISQGLSFALIIYALVLMIVYRRRPMGANHRRIYRQVIVCCLVFVPGFIHDIFFFANNTSIDSLPVVIIFFPLFFGILALGATFHFGLWLFRRRLEELRSQAAMIQPLTQPTSQQLAALGLSERESEVVGFLIEGLGNKQIADRLSLSTKTVNNHLYKIYQKLKVNSRWELIAKLNQN